jgi:hypothetical protein
MIERKYFPINLLKYLRLDVRDKYTVHYINKRIIKQLDTRGPFYIIPIKLGLYLNSTYPLLIRRQIRDKIKVLALDKQTRGVLTMHYDDIAPINKIII